MPEANTYQGRLDGRQRGRLKRLLDMFYKPSELAEEIGMSKDQIYRVYVPLGCPHQRDEKRSLWINGKEFREWYFETYKKKPCKPGESHCMTCKAFVKTINNETHETKEGLVYKLGFCPHCGRKIARIITQK